MSLEEVGIEVLLSGETSAGELAVIDEVIESDFDGPPLHLHPSFDEGFYVLEGELTFRVADEILTGGPGTFAFAQRGTPTGLRISAVSARACLSSARRPASSATSNVLPHDEQALIRRPGLAKQSPRPSESGPE